MTLPSGTVTFLFTDIEGSTTLVRQLRERYRDVLATHREILRGAVAEAGGSEIDTQGDSFFFVFPRAREAVLAAANAQRGLADHSWPDDGLVRVRMGIHTGEAAAVDGHYVGVAVHRAARIAASAHGGQVLLSQTTHNLLEDEEELPLDQRDLGEQRLKDFDRPVHVYQLVIPGLRERFPPLTTMPKREPRLPRLPAGRGRRSLLAAAVILAVGGLAAALILTTAKGGSEAVEPQSLVAIDPAGNDIVAQASLGSSPNAVAVGPKGVYAVSTESRTITRVGRGSQQVDSGAVNGVPSDVAVGDAGVWVVHSSSSNPTTPGTADAQVSRFDPESLGIQETIDTREAFDDTTYASQLVAGRQVWTSGMIGLGGRAFAPIVRIDPSGKVLVHGGASGLALEGDVLWAVTSDGVAHIDPVSLEPTIVPGPGSVGAAGATVAKVVAVGDGKVWVAGEVFGFCNKPVPTACKQRPGQLWRIDPGTNSVDDTTRIGREPNAIAFGGGAVWIADNETKSVYRLNPESLTLERKIELGQVPRDLAFGGGMLWVAVE